MLFNYALPTLVVLSVSVFSTPLAAKNATSLDLRRAEPTHKRDMTPFSTEGMDDATDVFSQDELTFIVRELHDVMIKYRNAGAVLNEVNVNQPDVYSNTGDDSSNSDDSQTSTSTAAPTSSASSQAKPLISATLDTTGTATFSSTLSLVPSIAATVALSPQSTSTAGDSTTQASFRNTSAQSPFDSQPTSDLAKRVIPGSAKLNVNDFISGSLDVMYWGNVQIGTPLQTLPVDLDTGSSDLWLPVNCTSNCQGKTQMKSQNSSTFIGSSTHFDVHYGSGSAEGTLAQDTVSYGGMPVSNQYWGAVQSQSSDFAKDPISGILGLAFGSIAASGKTPYFENLINNKQVSAPMFSLQMLSKKPTGSQLCLGCYDSSKYKGDVFWSPVVSQTYWSLSLTGLSADGKHNAVTKSIIAAIDTGTTLIYLPSAIANNFYGQIKGAASANQYGQGFYTFPCNSNLNLMISFANKAFTIDPVNFNLGKTSSGSSNCVGGVLAVGSGFPENLAIVGDAFLKTWYSIYDYSNGVRVGLASSTAKN